jgi:hypothetical protein
MLWHRTAPERQLKATEAKSFDKNKRNDADVIQSHQKKRSAAAGSAQAKRPKTSGPVLLRVPFVNCFTLSSVFCSCLLTDFFILFLLLLLDFSCTFLHFSSVAFMNDYVFSSTLVFLFFFSFSKILLSALCSFSLLALSRAFFTKVKTK